MFYKAFALLFLASTVAAELVNGLYRIASTKFEGAVIKSFGVGGTVSLVYGGQVFDKYQYWVVRKDYDSTPTLYTLENVGLDQVSWASDVGSDDPFHGYIHTLGNSTQKFYIETDDDKNYIIRKSDHSRVWTGDRVSPGTPHDGLIQLQDANGRQEQIWRFEPPACPSTLDSEASGIWDPLYKLWGLVVN